MSNACQIDDVFFPHLLVFICVKRLFLDQRVIFISIQGRSVLFGSLGIDDLTCFEVNLRHLLALLLEYLNM